MNDQNETTQLRYLEETAIRLRQNGFTVEPIEDHHLPVCWEKGRLCRISGIAFFVKLGGAYFDYRQRGQFEWSATRS